MAHLSRVESTALSELAAALRSRFGARLHSLKLFGSRARGEGRDDSDLDVLVLVVGLVRSERREIQDMAFDIGFRNLLLLSPLVSDSTTWRKDLPLAAAIAREGIEL